MRFWFVHSSDVPLHQQIVTQISLGILSGELAPGERLPSIRELARRFKLHPNTVSTAYRQLERDRTVTMRRGSGVYVREQAPGPQAADAVDSLLTQLLHVARAASVDLPELERRLRALAAPDRITRFVLVEPEPELAVIVRAELAGKVRLPLSVVATAEQLHAVELAGVAILTLPSKRETVCAALPEGTCFHALEIRSVPASLAEWLPAPRTALVGIASGWPRFLQLARTMLVAAGFEADSIVMRDTRARTGRAAFGRLRRSSAIA